MSLDLDKRQRAMLREMGIRLCSHPAQPQKQPPRPKRQLCERPHLRQHPHRQL
jgi:hypothetical protein